MTVQDGRYFVRRLEAQGHRPVPEAEFEVQVLGSDGLTAYSVYIAADTAAVVTIRYANRKESNTDSLIDHGVPRAVIDAACDRLVGRGEYVNSLGKIVLPGFLSGREL